MKSIYLEDAYQKEFDAIVESSYGDHIILDRTAFYPQSGGQPSDLGRLHREGEKFNVLRAECTEGRIEHIVDKEGLTLGDTVHGELDWERRYRLMRSHTACHILSAVIFRETGAKISGNQIDLSRSRVDFNLENFDKAMIGKYVEQANRVIKEDRPVRTILLPRSDAVAIADLVRLAMDVPDREEIRVVEIEGIDTQACGGTHVMRTGEIKGIKMIKAENKGRSNRRVYFSLED
jgi:misacylated tRNA(Ala) deacylase